MAHRYEKGSVVGFVLVGMVLTTLFVGGVYLARHANEVNSTTSNQVASETQSDSSNTDTTSDASSGSNSVSDTLKQQEEKNNQSNSGSSSSSSSSNASSSQASGETSQSTEDQQLAGNTGSAGSSAVIGNRLPSTGVNVDALPTTGPVEDALAVAAGAGLLGLALAYVKSRRLI